MCSPINEAPIWSEGMIVDSNGIWMYQPPPGTYILFTPPSSGVVVYDRQNGITLASGEPPVHGSGIGPWCSSRPTSLAKRSNWPHASPPFPLSCPSPSSGPIMSRSRQTACLRAGRRDQRSRGWNSRVDPPAPPSSVDTDVLWTTSPRGFPVDTREPRPCSFARPDCRHILLEFVSSSGESFLVTQ
jgi:hypothetical protein